MFLGLTLILGALLWARDIRRRARSGTSGIRGPLIMGGVGAAVFLFYLWVVTSGALGE
ncbi:MAG TPA: hypothetical protein PKZ35_10185 [Gammaproteobacteria bacterium]|nr:hypothetical protein [Gammaproteobacteria bacterium]